MFFAQLGVILDSFPAAEHKSWKTVSSRHLSNLSIPLIPAVVALIQALLICPPENLHGTETNTQVLWSQRDPFLTHICCLLMAWPCNNNLAFPSSSSCEWKWDPSLRCASRVPETVCVRGLACCSTTRSSTNTGFLPDTFFFSLLIHVS